MAGVNRFLLCKEVIVMFCLADLDAVYAEDEAEAAPTKTKTRGRKPKAAATETAADLDTAAEAEAADPAAADPAGSSSGTSSDEEQEAEALTAAAAAAGEGEEGEEGEGDVDFGIIEDPAPYIILKLSDNEDTRAIWPHKFDLYYKVSARQQLLLFVACGCRIRRKTD